MTEVWLWLWVALGGAGGALMRFWLSRFSAWRWGSSIPATFTVNIVGCFLLGVGLVWIGALGSDGMYARSSYIWLELGFIGGFTTFSTFAVETRGLLPNDWGKAVAYMLGSFVGALLALIVGYIVGGVWVYG